ncbi:plasminogen-like [Bolinopsis microptera]|uniref:plasminogen-like n=1 Tax=Bolinopsis microptera TaxID=2820187 RepID=UPI003079B846
MGSGYRGTLSVTMGGHTCQKWTEQSPYEHVYTVDKFNDKGIGDHNYCRNPDGEDDNYTELEAWCYTTSLTKRWDWCEIPTCHTADIECWNKDNPLTMGSGYRGTLSVTMGGHTCQKWTEQSPYEHVYTVDKFNDKGIGDHNYCRNPDGEDDNYTELEAWCYTTSLTKRWDWCEIPTCHTAG